jgi:hypothetical protein
MKTLEAFFGRLQSLHRKGIYGQRKNAVLHVLYHKMQMKILKLRARGLQNLLECAVLLGEYLRALPARFELIPAFDMESYEKSLCSPNPRIILERRVRLLRSRMRELTEQKPGTGDWYFNLLHPDSRTGRIIARFEQRIDELRYEDLFAIVEHLADNRKKFKIIEAVCFDIAWAHRPFPFGFAAAGKVLPVRGDLFPAVIGPTLIDEEFAFTPFSVLNRMNWPFKRAVDMIFEMMIRTNPFDIARVYWNVIKAAAECMHDVLVKRGVRAEDVEIDFDSLFPILMICVFTFGIDEWMQVALYAVSFNDNVPDDHELQFAMTYLEGLVTQIIALDLEELKKKAMELRREWADHLSDPLGFS